MSLSWSEQSEIFDAFYQGYEFTSSDFCSDVNQQVADYINDHYFLEGEITDEEGDSYLVSCRADSTRYGEKVGFVCEGERDFFFSTSFYEDCVEGFLDYLKSYLDEWLEEHGYYTEEWLEIVRAKDGDREAEVKFVDALVEFEEAFEKYFYEEIVGDYAQSLLDEVTLIVSEK